MDETVRVFDALLDTSSEPTLLMDVDRRVVRANAAARTLFAEIGQPADLDLLAVLVGADAPAGDRAGAHSDRLTALQRTLAAGWRTAVPVSTSAVLADGRRWRVEAWRMAVDSPSAPRLLVRLRPHERVVERFSVLDAKLAELSAEVRRRRAAQHRLRRTAAELETVFGRAPIGMVVAEIEHVAAVHLRRANTAFQTLCGYDELALSRMSLEDLFGPGHAELTATAFSQLLVDERPSVSFEAALQRRNGTEVWVEVRASLMHPPEDIDAAAAQDREDARVVLQVTDLSDRRRFETELRYLADHDALTGLYNRRRFEEELRDAVAEVHRYGICTTVLMIDLDNFKAVNDTYGHAAGDRLITEVAGVLRRRLRETDVLGRLGGDEFAAVLPHTGPDAAVELAEELRAGIQACGRGVAHGPLWVTATIGVAELPPDVGATHTGAEVLVDADAAMYEAKEAGRDRVAVVQRGGLTAGGRAGHTWVQRVRDALHHERLVLHAQPILDLRTGRPTRCELLLRLNADGQVVAPGIFLGVAEQFGLIHDIDRWVVDQAVRLLASWQRGPAELRDMTVEVNLSGASITEVRVVDAIEELILAAGIDASRLVFEITETAAIRNMERARRFARRLGELGCTFALDDFGSGFGSLQYLKHLPADCLKIDGDFIRRLPEDEADRVMVKAIVHLARGLGKQTAAEFVDRPETLAVVREFGVDFAQGYHIGRPGPVGELLCTSSDLP